MINHLIFSNVAYILFLNVFLLSPFIAYCQPAPYISRIPQLIVRPSKLYLEKKSDVLLHCTLGTLPNSDLSKLTFEPPPRLRNVQWFKDGSKIDESSREEGILIDGAVLQISARGHRTEHEGEYECSASLQFSSNSVSQLLSSLPSSHWSESELSNWGPIKSPTILIQTTYLKRFPANVVDSKFEIREGSMAYVPCEDIPKSIPGPPTIWFEKKRPDSKEEIKGTKDGSYIITGSGLLIPNAQKRDEGFYRCVAQNPVSNRTRRSRKWTELRLESKFVDKPLELDKDMLKATLVYPTQKITKVEAAVSNSVTLDCVSSNGNVSWMKVGDPTWSISTAKGVQVKYGSLIISNVNIHDQGKYECSAIPPIKDFSISDVKHESIVGAIYHLKIIDKPNAKLSINAIETEGVYRVYCNAGNNTNNHAQLYLNGQVVLANGNGGVVNTLRVVDTRYSEGGWIFTLAIDSKYKTVFQCIVKPPGALFTQVSGSSCNELFLADAPETTTPSERSSPLLANVLHSPTIVDAPENTTRMEMEDATLICQVSLNVRKVLWLKDGQPLDTSSDRLRVFGSGTLSISNLKIQDSGVYTCVAQGFHENVTANAYLNVQKNRYLFMMPDIDTDLFLRPPTLMTSTANSVIESILDPEDQYYDEDEEEYDQEDDTTTTPVQLATVEEMGSGFTATSNLFTEDVMETTTIANTRPFLEELDNEYDSLPPPSTEEKVARPDPPVVHIIDYNSAVVTMPYNNLLNHLGVVSHFKVQWKKGKGHWLTTNEDIPASTRQHTIYGLVPGARYKFRVGIAFDRRTVTSKASKYLRTPSLQEIHSIYAPKLPPLITKTKSVSQDAIEVKWDYPEEELARIDGFILQFEIDYGHIQDSGRTIVGGNMTVEGGLTQEAVIDSLIPATNYRISMQSYNSAGRSRSSNAVTEATLMDNNDTLLGVDGTRPPVNFVADTPDTSLAPSKGMSNASLDVLLSPSKKVTFLRLSSTTLLICFVGFLAVLLIALSVGLVFCTCKERKQKKARIVSDGRFQDTSKRIYSEQHSKGKLALYHEALIAQPDEVQAMLEPPETERSWVRNTEYGIEETDSNRNRVDTPMKGCTFGMSSPLPPMNLYGTTPILDSSDSLNRSRNGIGRANTPPGYHPDSAEFGSEEERQHSTPECDALNAGGYLGVPPPPMATSSPQPLTPFHRGYLSPYHSILNAASPSHQDRCSNSSNEQGSVRIPVLHLHTSSATVSPATSGTDGSVSPHRYRGSPADRQPRVQTTPIRRGGSINGPVSPLGNLSAEQYEAMWTRGGDQGGGSLRRVTPTNDKSPQFYTFKPPSQRSNYSPLRLNTTAPVVPSPGPNSNSTVGYEGYMSDDH